MNASPPAAPAVAAILEPGTAPWLRQARLARALAWLSLAYMTAEGAIAVAAAIAAGSAALLGAIRVLVTGERPATSWPGITVAAASVIVMPLLGTAKKRIGARLGSAAVSGEGAENILCAATAAAVLAGMAANAGPGWWWLDPAIALGIAVLAIREGREAREGCED